MRHVLVLFRQTGLCLTAEVFCDSYCTANDLLISSSSAWCFQCNAFSLWPNKEEKVVVLVPGGTEDPTESYWPLQMLLLSVCCSTQQISHGKQSAEPTLQRDCMIMQMACDSVTVCESPNAQKIYHNAATREISAEPPRILKGPLHPS